MSLALVAPTTAPVVRPTIGRCTGNPRYVPVTDVTPADERAREDSGWTRTNHEYRATKGKPGAWTIAVPCHYSTDDMPAYAAHMREAHGARRYTSGALTGHGFKAPAPTVTEKLTLGEGAIVTLEDGTKLTGQVWADADATLIGARRSSAVFVVAAGRSFVVGVDTKAPGAPMAGRAVGNDGRGIGERVTVSLVRGPAAEMTLLPEPMPVQTPAARATSAIVAASDELTRASAIGAAYFVAHESDETPADFIAGRRARKAGRRELAGMLRADGLEPSGLVWTAATITAGLVSLETVR